MKLNRPVSFAKNIILLFLFLYNGLAKTAIRPVVDINNSLISTKQNRSKKYEI